MKEIAELIQAVGLPTVVIAYFLIKDYRQGTAGTNATQAILATQVQQLEASTALKNALQGIHDTMVEIKIKQDAK